MRKQQDKSVGDFQFNIGDTIRVKPPTIAVVTPYNRDLLCANHLRVVYRFWNGKERIYLVESQDGIGACLQESHAMLETKSMILHDVVEKIPNSRRIRLYISSFLLRLAKAVQQNKQDAKEWTIIAKPFSR